MESKRTHSFSRYACHRVHAIAKLITGGLIVLSASLHADGNDQRPNFLFIAIDDLRPELNCYGESQVISPNIDRLADEGLLFERAYCQVPVCGASRSSIMGGIYGTPERFVNYKAELEKDAPGIVSLPGYLKRNGYTTRSLGKVFHDAKDHEEDWDVLWKPRGHFVRDYLTPKSREIEANVKGSKGPAYEKADVPDEAYRDGKIALRAIDALKELKQGDQPFFLGVGFYKPHLPFNAPAKYWDMYSEEEIDVADNPFKPLGAPDIAMDTPGELGSYYGFERHKPVEDEDSRKLIHGYYACISYVDAQIGKVLAALDELGLAENTVVVLWADHGYHLGEHGLWTKHCNFEKVMRVPLIIEAPGPQYAHGAKTDALVELIDLYPTIVALAGLPLPRHLQGDNLIPLLKSPDTPLKPFVYSRWQGGDTVITEQYIYTRWFDDGKPAERMLYDLRRDPGENKNIAEDPAFADTVKKLDEAILVGQQEAKLNE